MYKIFPVVVILLMLTVLQSCSKKNVPSKSETTTETKINPSTTIKKSDSVAVTKPVAKRKTTTAVPKVITVNDQFASKSVDGRLYYDLSGHRYWRSNKDGKYYLFNKSMQNDDAFKKPVQQ